MIVFNWEEKYKNFSSMLYYSSKLCGVETIYAKSMTDFSA